MSTPEELLCRRGWRLRHSLWMLWGILSFGLLWGVGFAIVGVRARHRLWLVMAGVWLVYLIVEFWVLGSTDMPAKGEPATALSSAMGNVMLLSWIVGGVLAWFVNRRWLVWRAHHGPRRPWYITTTGSAGDGGASPAAPVVTAGMVDEVLRSAEPTRPRGAETARTVAPPAQWISSASTPQPALGVQVATSGAAETPQTPLDLNTASRDQLANLPGIDLAWADHIIAIRQRQGGFSSPADLVTMASVQPHIFAAIRDRLVAGAPIARADSPSDGRRLEF